MRPVPSTMQQSKLRPITQGPKQQLVCFRGMITEQWRRATAEQATALQPTPAHEVDHITADEGAETLFPPGGRPQPQCRHATGIQTTPPLLRYPRP